MNDSSPKGASPTYWAFISYSSKDSATAKWLHKKIENYAIPKELQSVRFEDGTLLGRHLRPVFRDRDELSGGAELGEAISRALARSRFLIVLCSRDSARSSWVNKEILEFQAAGKSGNILALILNGEPNATSRSDVQDQEECFPPALRSPAEPLAGDLRRTGDGPDRGFLKVLAGVAQLDFDELYRRHERAQRQRRFVLSTIALSVMLALAGLAGIAITQKNRAEQERARAVKNEEEAQQQRDLARSHLARVYREKAQQPDIGTAESLAWAVKAAESNPGLLDSRAFQGQIAAWAGPFPGPDTCEPTGVRKSGGFSNSFEHYLSRKHQRLILQNSDSSWRLIDWKGPTTLASSLTAGQIREFLSAPDESWFAFVSYKEADVRSWEDGRRLIRIEFAGKGSFSAATTCGSKLLVGLHKDSGETNETRILAWDPLHPEEASWLGPPIEGELQVFSGAENGKALRLLGITRIGDKTHRLLRSLPAPEGEWEDDPEPTGANPPRFLSFKGHFDHPPGTRVLFRDEPPHEVHDLHEGLVHPLDLGDDQYLVGLLRGAAGLDALVKTTSGNESRLEWIDLASGSRSQLFEGKPVTTLYCDSRTGLVSAWDDASDSLLLHKPDGSEVSRPVRPPLGLSFVPLEIRGMSERLVLVEGHTFPKGLECLLLIDLNTEEGERVHLVCVPEFNEALEFGTDSNGDARVRVLSHEFSSISTAGNIPSLHELGLTFGTRIHASEGAPLHLEVDDDGRFRILSMREHDGADELRWLKSGGDAPWVRSQRRLMSSPNFFVRDDHICLAEPGGSFLIDPSGNPLWRDKAGVGGKARPIKFDSRLFLLDEGYQGVSLVDPISGKTVWNHPLDDSINFILPQDENQRLLVATSTRSLDESSSRISLREWQLSDGSEIANASLQLDHLEPYGSNFEILGTSPPLLLIDQQSVGGPHECVIYKSEGERLVECLRWIRPEFVPSLHVAGKGMVVDFSDAASGRHEAAWLTIKGDALQRIPIPLPEPLYSIHSNPTGRQILFSMENAMLLWDIETFAPVGGLLSLGTEFGRELRPGHLYRPLWSKDGEFLHLCYGWSIYRLDANTGERVDTLDGHQPPTGEDGRTPEVAQMAISPNGTWFASVDELGRIRVSRCDYPTMNTESLRDFSHRAGGKAIDARGDLVPWSP